MGYLLKEALKALCGVNQWSYAVFWKFGCQNPKLLIWEECYHGSMSNPNALHISNMGNQGITLQKLEGYNGARVGDSVHLLIDKMMMSKQVNMVGEGLVGRTAFTGNHQWIVSGNYNENAHPAEVLNEVNLQFSAGMQTIAVIPVIPHGVVQLASPLAVVCFIFGSLTRKRKAIIDCLRSIMHRIVENVGFVHDVKSLILQVGCVPSTFMSENYGARNSSSLYGPPVDATSIPLDLHENQIHMNSSLLATDSFNLPQNTFKAQRHANHSSNSLLAQFQDNLHVSGSRFTMPNLMQESCKSLGDHNTAKISSVVDNKVNAGIVMPLKPDSLINQQACSNNPVSGVNCRRPSASSRSTSLLEQPIISSGGVPEGNHKISSSSSNISAPHFNTNKGYHAIMEGCSTNHMSSELGVGVNGEHSHLLQKCIHANVGLHEADTSIKELVAMLNTGDQLCSRSILGLPIHENNNGDNGHRAKHNHGKGHDSDMQEVLKINSKPQEHMLSVDSAPGVFCCGSKVTSSKDPVSEDVLFQSSAGDDLFDVLGVDFKNKLLNGNDSKLQNRLDANAKDQIKNFPWSVNLQNLSSDFCSDYYDGISESGVCSLSGSDHLLDAVISGVSAASREISDDNMSCRTTLSKISNSSIPSTPQSNPSLSGLVNMSDQMQGQLFWISKPMMRLGEPVSTSIRSACGKNVSGNCSLSSSTYGSQLSSWIEQGPSVSVSTANSKKPDETGKTNRKRLKPGENPRPRPKDRQMIQDRVKELREIVPNGAKCSIDALLERTIKHMLFLQSVTKHADKLKQTVESKITNREDGKLLKDNFEGGATWAFELGSQSMVCPIVVEDLNPPRQLLIEMLCEERGFFLEIADIIRGLGLTILKGVMEARNDKIWARFAVEANRDVTRMDVFISLVHLLEQTLNGSSASANGTTD